MFGLCIEDMKIPFIKIPQPNWEMFTSIFKDSIDANQYTNFGPNEQKLVELLGEKTGYPVVVSTNATLILEGLHDILSELCSVAYLPGFTFPATNQGCRIKYRFGETQTYGDSLGFSKFEKVGEETDYSITTVPFGTDKPGEYERPETTFWIVDNAAGSSTNMNKVTEWLSAGADAVVCSLHATKVMSACEGGFVAFRNNYLYETYKKYINFGFYSDRDGNKQLEDKGSNHKMSELSAAFALMYYKSIFNVDYMGRTDLMNVYKNFCLKHDFRFIKSQQAFWILCHSSASEMENKFAEKGIQTRPYYRPLWRENEVDAGSLILSRSGLCLPTWNMNDDEKEYVLNNMKLLL